MTKEEFEKYNGMLHCKNCGVNVPKIHINHKRVYKNGDIAKCNVCEWIKRHNGIPQVIGFDESEIIVALHFLLYEESIYINVLAKKLHRSLNEAISLFRELKIGNKKCLVKVKCEYCKEWTDKPINVYLENDHVYCSLDCYWKDKTNKMPHGENSPFYNRIKTKCTNCKKDIDIIPYNYNTENSFGDNHNFCSKECYWEYRSKYYVGEKSHMKNYEYTKEQREKMRLTVLNNCRSSKRFDSKVQLKINHILEEQNILYEREHTIKYYAVDNYLSDYNLIIEVMGDYWHGNPLKYNENNYLLNDIQQKTILKDKQKSSYILNHENIRMLYLWEQDIDNRPKLCKELILLYIKNNGILKNYHSFNWNLEEGSLFLCNDLIIPYQSMDTDEYRNIIKNKVG